MYCQAYRSEQSVPTLVSRLPSLLCFAHTRVVHQTAAASCRRTARFSLRYTPTESIMQSYHSSLLVLCKTCDTLAKTSAAAGSDLDSAFRTVNSQRRTLRLSGPQISKSSCVHTLLEHACYLLRLQRDGTTEWVTDVVVGHFLEVTASTSFIITEDLRWSSESGVRKSVKRQGETGGDQSQLSQLTGSAHPS